MASKATALVKRADRLAEKRVLWEPLWRDLALYILPRKSNILLGKQPGSKQTEKLFDSTAIHANEVLAASIQGALTNPIVRWFALRMREAGLNETKEIADWLDECSVRIFLAIQQSNFNAAINEVYLDLGAFGVSGLLCEERGLIVPTFNGFVFSPLTIGEFSVEENFEGVVDTVFRRFQLPARVALTQWPAVSDKVKEKAEKDPEHSVAVLHAVFPRTDRKLGSQHPRQRPWASFYVEVETKTLLHEGGYEEMPYAVPRWAKTSGETYGRGPGFTALPDVKTLNRGKEFDLKAWAKSIDPPMQVLDDGVIGTVKLTPGAPNSVRVMDAIKPIEFGAKHDVSMLEVGDLRASIRQIFFNDQLQLPDKTIITATEVERRLELMQRVLGPTIGRLETELLSPLVTRWFALMYRHGALPTAPPLVLQAAASAQGDIDIVYEGPLARAQRGSEVLAAQRFLELALPLAQVEPTVLDNIEFDELLRGLAKQTSLPSRYLKAVEAVQKIREARVRAQEAANQASATREDAAALGKVAPALAAMTA